MNDAHANGLQDGLGAVAGVELLVDRREVVLDGLLGDVEALGDLGCSAPIRDELEDLFLALGDHALLLGAGFLVQPTHLLEHRLCELG